MDNKYAKILILFVAILLIVLVLYVAFNNNSGMQNNIKNDEQTEGIYIE